jgi:transcription antitermination factor NusG
MNDLERSTSDSLLTSSGLTPDQASWFAVQTRPRYEKQVTAELEEKGIKTFLPLCSARHQWSDRQRIVELPLFPSYVFVRIAAVQETRIAVLRTHGVNSFVGARGMGTPIPDGELAAVQEILEHRIPFQMYPFLRIGQRVCIRGGCLNGIRGILTAINGDYSLVVSVELIQRSVAVRLSGYQVEPDRAESNSLAEDKRSQRERTALGITCNSFLELRQEGPINRQPDMALP